MKKILLIASLFIFSSFNHNYSTTWAGNASNQALTKTAFENGIGTTYLVYAMGAAWTVGTGQDCITKSEVLAGTTWVSLNTSYPAWSAKSGNSLVTKSDITMSVSVSTASGAGSCSHGGSQTLYTDVNIIRWYTDAAMTTPFAGSGNYYTTGLGFDVQINSSGYTTNTFSC
jgi:hypothetical protein